MKPEQEFDKIIKQRIDESESDFAFDETNWQKASRLIDAERGVAGYRKNNKYLLLGALFLLLGTVGFFSYKYISNSGSDTATANTGKNSADNPGLIAENSSGANLNKNAAPVNSQVNESTGSASTIEKESKEALAITKSLNSPQQTSGVENGLIASARTSPVHNNKTGLNSKTGFSNSSVSTSGSKDARKVSDARNDNNLENGPDRNTVADNSQQGATLIPAEAGANRESAGSNMYENLFLKTKITGLPDHNIDGEIRKTSYDFIRIYNDDYFKSKRRKTFYLDAEIGTAYMFGWNTPKGTDAQGFNAYAGLNFGFHIKKKFSASVGAQVYNTSNIQQPFYTGSSITYDFGSNGTYTSVVTNSLLYMAIPVKIHYAIDKRNSIALGANTGFLFNGQNTIETYHISDGVKSDVNHTKNTGYYEGTNTINIMITAGYSRAINRRTKLNAEFMYGVSDVYKNTSVNSTRENNVGVRLGLQYTLFDK